MSARLAAALAAGIVLLVGPGAGVAAAAPCDVPVVSEVACENSKPGSPSSQWDVAGAGDASIQGFATDMSVNRGSLVQFKVATAATAYRLDIYRIGYYAGNGARLQATVRPLQAVQAQPACTSNAATGLVDCGNWAVSASWSVPANAVSGVYVAKLVREDGPAGASHIMFIVRDDASTSDVLLQTADTTWQAYNRYGGNSLYVGSPAGRAYKVSYNRPLTIRGYASEDGFFSAEYPMVRWLERNGYDVSYFSGVDSDRRGNLIRNHRTFISVGHDEYWSGGQRSNVEAARDAGTNLAFFSGNEVFWKTRWEPSIDGSNTAHRTLVSYKETHAGAKIDPLPGVWTGTWRDPRFSPPADGGRPENALTGQLFTVNDGATTAIRVPASYGKLRLWRNTSVATLAAGATATLADSTLGYEWDEDVDNGFRPGGSIRMSSTTVDGAPVLQDYGSSYGSATAVHHLSLYRAGSGALVFGAGTVQWAWGLDSTHDRGSGAADARMQQATANLLADLRAQPATLQSGLVAPTASTDITAASSTITSPAADATVAPGTPVTVSGTATDAGGVVGGVEVSVDGGATWRAANGLASWTYSFTPAASGTVTIRSRATDDSANRETPSAGRTITVGSGPAGGSCPCSLWSSATVPGKVAETADGNAVEVGVKFRSEVGGTVTGLRFYKGSTNTGTHVGRLWSAGGAQLASVTFSGETASGWQQANLSSPVAVTAGTTYVASYFAPNGNYAVDENYFASAFVNGPLRALSSAEGGGNGVYSYGASSFPVNSYNASNYWVDVVFSEAAAPPDTTAPTVASVSPADGATGVSTAVTPTATFSEAMNAATITTSTVQLSGPAGSVAASVAYDSGARRVTLTPAGVLAGSTVYTMTVKGGASGVADTAGNRLAADRTWTFTTAAPPPPDTAPPVISGVVASATTGGVATVSWSTDEASSSRVDYGSDAGSLGLNVVDGTRVTSHSVQVAGLTPGSTYFFRVTSVDAAGNSATSPAPPAAPASFTVPTAGGSCPCSLWSSATVPGKVAETADGNAVEVGVKFRSEVGGTVTGLRFYKGSTNTGTHVGRLWSAGGAQLASVTFSGETASGWQQANLSSPVAVTAGTTYVASYFAPNGNYAVDENYFASAFVNGPLRALSSAEGGGNGVYSYGASSFPVNSYNASNYWVDVVFSEAAAPPDTTAPTVASVSPADGATGVSTAVTPTATFSEAMNAATITTSTVQLSGPAGSVAASVAYDSGARRVTLTPAGVLAGSTVYTMTVKGGASGVADTAGNRLAADRTWTFTTAAPPPPDTAPPVISGVVASATTGGVATVSWSTDEASSSRVDYGSDAGSLGLNVVDGTRVTSHSVQVAGLTPGSTYFFRVTSVDAAGNSATSPAPPAAPASFTVPVVAPVRVPSAVVIDAGTLRSGTFENLAANDGSYFRTNSTTTLGTRTSSWYGRMTGVPTALSSLKVTYAGFNSRACTQVLQVYQWTTSAWVQIDSRSVSTTQVLIADLSPSGAAASYVSSGGEVRVRVRCTASANFNTSGNFMQISYGT